jgi:hypothetical protein
MRPELLRIHEAIPNCIKNPIEFTYENQTANK